MSDFDYLKRLLKEYTHVLGGNTRSMWHRRERA